jgi:hypothetical protein
LPHNKKKVFALRSGLPDFSCNNIPKREKLPKLPQIYQMAINIRNGIKRDPMETKFTNIFQCKTLQNLPKIGIFGLKIYHLATLLALTASNELSIQT